MKHFLWRVWFFGGLGGSIASVFILLTATVRPSTVLIAWFVFCWSGLGQGLYRIVLRRDNPFNFFEPMRF